MSDPDETLHVHVFSHAEDRPPGDVLGAITELNDPRVRFASQFIGSFQVYAHLEVESIADAQDLANSLWPQGIRTEMGVEIKVAQRGPKRGSPDHCALIRVRPRDDPFEVLDRIEARFEPLFDPEEYTWGAAVITGRGYDLLVDLGRPTIGQLRKAILDELREVEGIGKTDTSFADLRVNAFRPEG
ncbi:MAG TPA: hypothetical protein VID69_00175 [Actinomycetota bacterium]|jgi:hypothetical protein